LNFYGFKDVINKGKIVILKMNIAQYRNLAKTIAAYIKLDFQSEVMQRLVREGANTERPVFLICDEFHEFVTATDAEFFAQSREPKCISIVATQSYTSLINTLKDRDMVRTVTQNLINKIWLRTDDLFTVEEAQKQTGKEDKEKVSRSISENSGDVKKSRILGTLVSDKASVSESININTVKEYVFDEKLFTQLLDVFTGICFLSDGAKIIEPSIVYLQPYFSDAIKNGIKRTKLPDKAEPSKTMSESILCINSGENREEAYDEQSKAQVNDMDVYKKDKLLNDVYLKFVGMSTAAAGVGVGTGVFMKKLSLGKQERIELGNKVIKDSIIGWITLNALTLILNWASSYTK